MFHSITFEWLLKFIYNLAKASGYIFTSIDFKTMKMKNRVYASFIVSFGFSLYANTFDAMLEVEAITHSKIMDMGFNLFIKFALSIVVFLKLSNLIQIRKFYQIISDIIWCHTKVRSQSIYKQRLIFFSAAGKHWNDIDQ